MLYRKTRTVAKRQSIATDNARERQTRRKTGCNSGVFSAAEGRSWSRTRNTRNAPMRFACREQPILVCRRNALRLRADHPDHPGAHHPLGQHLIVRETSELRTSRALALD